METSCIKFKTLNEVGIFAVTRSQNIVFVSRLETEEPSEITPALMHPEMQKQFGKQSEELVNMQLNSLPVWKFRHIIFVFGFIALF